MPSYDFQTGLSGAASGASTGAAVGSVVPGIGTAIGAGAGAVLGLGAGFFGGDDKAEQRRQKAIRRNKALVNMLEGRYERAEDRTATESDIFQTGAAQAEERLRDQTERDEAQAAARGLTGSQFEVAQDAARAEQQGRQERQFLLEGARQNRRDERQALQAMLNAEQNLTQTMLQSAQAEERQQQRQNQQVMQSLMQLGPSLAGGFGGGQAATDMPTGASDTFAPPRRRPMDFGGPAGFATA